jgi:hypothetical protein
MLMYAERQKCRMLIRVFELLQQEDFAGLYTRFPSVRGWFDAPLRRSVALQDDELVLSLGDAEKLASQAFSDALQYALVLANDRNPSGVQVVCAYIGREPGPELEHRYGSLPCGTKAETLRMYNTVRSCFRRTVSRQF